MSGIRTETNVSQRSKHTPGPWRVDPGSRDFPFSVRPGLTGGLVASVCNSILWHDDPAQTEANARLIAAAPDLLAALVLLHDNLAEYQRINNLGGYDNHDMKMAREAIAKAKA